MYSTASIEIGDSAEGFDISNLAEILFYCGGLTREVNSPIGKYYMRAAPATGALYPIELYVICQDINGLNAGIYHFSPKNFGLTQLRSGDYRRELAKISGKSDEILNSPAIIVFTSIAWRNSWKYQARSYRHWFWDSGVMAANLLATTISEGLRSSIIIGFRDDEVNNLLGLTFGKEAAIAISPIGIGLGEQSSISIEKIPSINLETTPSTEEVDFPEIWDAHRESSLSNENEVELWNNTEEIAERSLDIKGNSSHPLHQNIYQPNNQPHLDRVILQRGSTRRFRQKPITYNDLSDIIISSTKGIPMDFLKKRGSSIIETYLIINSVENLHSGAYFFDRLTGSLILIKRGEFRNNSGYLCLEQPLFSSASVVFFLMADLQKITDNYGNRGYRAAQFEAGVIAGKIYISAYSSGIGASGSTFYDDAVSNFFLPYSEGRDTMIAIGIGIPDYKSTPGKVLGRITE